MGLIERLRKLESRRLNRDGFLVLRHPTPEQIERARADYMRKRGTEPRIIAIRRAPPDGAHG